MKINKVEIDSSCGKHNLSKKGVSYEFDGVLLRIYDDGTVTLMANETELSFVRLYIENSYFKNAKILGDEFERAYGNMEWSGIDDSKSYPWYFMAYETGVTYCFGVETLPNSLCSWRCSDHEIILDIDVRNGSNPISLKGRMLELCRIVTLNSHESPFNTAAKFCKIMCSKPHLSHKVVYGGNDWYCNYGDNSHDKIIDHTKRIAECAPKGGQKPYMVVDDGWELCHHVGPDGSAEYFNGGPWGYCNSNFGDMKRLADDIAEYGVIPGIWFRPLWTVEKVPDECVLRKDGIKCTLDPSSQTVLTKVRDDVMMIKSWGYGLIKHDFTTYDIFGRWGAEMNDDMCQNKIDFADRTKTTAEIIKNFYRTIRDAAGDHILIMGCNTVSHLSAGIFDIQRTGDDTSGLEWARTRKMGINTLAFRMCQHNTFYLADADCVGVTKNVPWEKNRRWLDVLSKSGTPLFVSIAEDAFTNEVKKDITAAFERAAHNTDASEPIDWMETKIPQKWKSTFGTDEYEW